MFTVTVAMEECGTYTDWAQAFKRLHEGISPIVEAGNQQMLDMACWIECRRLVSGESEILTMDWYEARDAAYWCGVMKDGQLVDPPPTILPELGFCLFLGADFERRGMKHAI